MSDQQKRYVPPHRRAANSSYRGDHGEKPAARYPGNRPFPQHYRLSDDAQRSHRPFPQQYFGNEEFIITFKSSKFYEETDLPSTLMELVKPETGMKSYKFKIVFNYSKLRLLIRWFRNAGRNDPQAVLEFPSAMDKGQRKEVHQMADNFGLATSSKGFGGMRFISVYTEETAAQGDIGMISLTEDERKKSQDVWTLVCKMGCEYSKYSHNEIDEMILANQLDPLLQDLLDNHKDSLESEFESKCKVSQKTNNWRDECKY